MKFKKIFCAALTMGVLLSSIPVSAKVEESVIMDNNANMTADAKLESMDGYMGVLSKTDFELTIPQAAQNDVMTIDAETGDNYEPNNGPDKATNNQKGSAVSANIHDETDVDWYKFEVTSEDVENQTLYSFVLTDIPQTCDYDMYLANANFQATADLKEGPASEQMVCSFNQAGTYYVVIQSASGYNASYNYKLYFGPSWKNGSTGWRTTGLTFHFPNRDAGVGSDYLSANEGWQIYDGFRTDSSIPVNSMVERFYLDADGTGTNTWGGFHKRILAASEPNVYYEQFGGIDIFNLQAGKYPVKQQWGITGVINYANYFVWKPNVCVDYKFPVIIDNMRFI